MPRATTITPRSSGGRGPTRGALPLVDSGGGVGGRDKKNKIDDKALDEETDDEGDITLLSDSEDIDEPLTLSPEDEVETDSDDPDADDPYARGLPTPRTAPRPRKPSPKRPRYNDVGERIDSGDDDDESDFEGYDDDMFEHATRGGGGGGGGGAGGSSGGGKGRWFTKNGRRVYKVGNREFSGGAAMARYRQDSVGGASGASGGTTTTTRRRKTTRKKKRKTTKRKTTKKAAPRRRAAA